MGYRSVRHYPGGLEEWKDQVGRLEKGQEPRHEIVMHDAQGAHVAAGTGAAGEAEAPGIPTAPAASRAVPARGGLSDILIDWVGRRTISQLLQVWVWMIAGFGVLYWADGAVTGNALMAGGVPEGGGWRGLVDSIYFSFVTALSIGYGDVVPMGEMRVLAILEGAAGLLIFGCVISKLVSRRQDELLEQTHRIAFEDRLGRVRTNLHLVLSEIETIVERCNDPSTPRERITSRVESVATVFAGELRSIHDLLYRPQEIPDEQILESILASVSNGLRELNDLMVCLDGDQRRSAAIDAALRDIRQLAGEICGECVPRDYAPELKDWMDRIQEQSHRIEHHPGAAPERG